MANCNRNLIKFVGLIIGLTIVICASIGIYNSLKNKPPACQKGYSCRDKDNHCDSGRVCRDQKCQSPGAKCASNETQDCKALGKICTDTPTCPPPCGGCPGSSPITAKIRVPGEDLYVSSCGKSTGDLELNSTGDIWTFTLVNSDTNNGPVYMISNQLGQCLYYESGGVNKFTVADECDINKHQLAIHSTYNPHYIPGTDPVWGTLWDFSEICQPVQRGYGLCLGTDIGNKGGGDPVVQWEIIEVN